ncbi:MAG TPA: dihydrolipoamide acetyltransferase family protein [Oleiagrimonas sp.]|nr:dihydrolipoamide acetyltransferase family protein [Oleiagrimonas sp.]
MADIKTFNLPDLGEGLPDATIVEWLVKEGDSVKLDAPFASMETAKAVVEVPSPYTGKVVKFHGEAGDVIETGAPLADFEPDPNAKQRAEAAGHGGHAPKKKKAPAPAPAPEPTSDGDGEREDEGTVVGAMVSGNQVHVEQTSSAGGVKAVPAVRATARKLKVDLARVTPSGEGGVITMADVKQAAADGTAVKGSAPAEQKAPAAAAPAQRSPVSAAGKPVRTRPPQQAEAASGQPEQLKGVRRNMARVMADAHARVVNTTIVDDADLNAWIGKQDITARLIRAIVSACKTVPTLNAWFDDDNLTLTRHPNVDIGIAVDTEDGLFVPALRNADMLDAQGVRAGVNRLRQQTMDRSIPSSELSGYTISLSNFGMFAGRYASPIVVPPCVAIVGAGGLSHDVVAVMGGVEVHRRLPVSLSFDHRAATGGDAARFLKAMIDDLALPQ